EYPHYTRPASSNGWDVPEVLISGHQKNIEIWRRQESLKKTNQSRPDLLLKSDLSESDKKFLKQFEVSELE
ncbi:MAG: tRNA (guanine(37)-N(1))-methyltransferase, partial [Deltaproteobacteria bacterium]